MQAIVRLSQRSGRAISISGGMHAMGGQQFGADTLHVDTRRLNHIGSLHRPSPEDNEAYIDVQAGVQWPALLASLTSQQQGNGERWTFRQKQTGADDLCLGGAVSSNIHSRALGVGPFVEDILHLRMVDATGRHLLLSRTSYADLFALAIGGYGLFGIITEVRLRLVPKQRLVRRVQEVDIDQAVERLEQAQQMGATYGDVQFAIDERSEDFLRRGILAVYYPTKNAEASRAAAPPTLLESDWHALARAAHSNKKSAYQTYASHYFGTDGAIFDTDVHQMAPYFPDYHRRLDQEAHQLHQSSEVITELYVPRARLGEFMRAAAVNLRATQANVIYGTVRLIEQDTTSFLPWATQPWACIVFNLHVDHTGQGIDQAKQQFRGLIDSALLFNGSYYLTYHPWATPQQLTRAYPHMIDFLRHKDRFDPQGRFVSAWYQNLRRQVAQAHRSGT